MSDAVLSKVRQLAKELSAEPDPYHKDDWERGFDAGQQSAGRQLATILLGES